MPAPTLEPSIAVKAKAIKLLALDVDGVMTDGKLYFSNSGEEMKTFSTLDGQGIKLLQNTGVVVAIITARTSQLVANRAENLGIKYLVQGCHNKLEALSDLLTLLNLSLDQTAYIGDDLPDLACILRVALGVTVPNAHQSILDQALCTTIAPGGSGAIREVCDWIMQAQNTYDDAIASYA